MLPTCRVCAPLNFIIYLARQVYGTLRKSLFWEKVDGPNGMYGLAHDLIDTSLLLPNGLPEIMVTLFTLVASALQETAPGGGASPRQIDFLRVRAAELRAAGSDFDAGLPAAVMRELFSDMDYLLTKMRRTATVVSVAGVQIWLRKQGVDKNSGAYVQVSPAHDMRTYVSVLAEDGADEENADCKCCIFFLSMLIKS